MILNLYQHRNYIIRNAWSDLRLRYAGSGMGIFWNVIIPVAQILIYTVVFSRLMSFRSPGMASNRYAFVLYLCSVQRPFGCAQDRRGSHLCWGFQIETL